MFWQNTIVPLIVYPIYVITYSVSVSYLLIQNIQIGLLFHNRGILMIIPVYI